ncbi:hypothetical protein PVAR5_2598 [Paecilomyces variotii No. 5]|uniref:Uncharacterized protein n=1 Tax=Byssochlamys spectabilis (strain No. 5 / NBRC 109023) TaxID=1356009 RepID=V5FPU7_BYSSN|nr:hypothetical protein PVAR5_2598 [Paecilomyces variotii No. 5]
MALSASPPFAVSLTTEYSIVATPITIPVATSLTSTPAPALPLSYTTDYNGYRKDQSFNYLDSVAQSDDDIKATGYISASPRPESELRGARGGGRGRGGQIHGHGCTICHNSANSSHYWDMKGLNLVPLMVLYGCLVAGAGILFGGGLGA